MSLTQQLGFGQWNKLAEACLITAVFIIVFLLNYLVFKLLERMKKPSGILSNHNYKILPCRQCQLIAMGEMASYNGLCPTCEKIPPPGILFGIV